MKKAGCGPALFTLQLGGTMPYCGSRSLVKRKGNIGHVMPLRCRSWGCPTCAPRRRARLIREAKSGKPNRFATLTCNPHWFDSPEERGLKLAAGWRAYVRWYRKRYPKRGIEYLAVMELTKLGEPHLHILCRSGWIDFKELSKFMAEFLGAPHVYIEAIQRRTAVAKYVAKYISKRNIKLGTCKRYWRSMHYLPESNAARRKRLAAGASFMVIDWSCDALVWKLRGHRLTEPDEKTGEWMFWWGVQETSPPFSGL